MGAKKNFVIDTNVILHDYNCLKNFQENDIYLPIVVLEELDKFKKGNEQINFNAREFVRELDMITDDNLFTKGAPLGEGLGRLFVVAGSIDSSRVHNSFPERIPDHQILSVVDWLTEKKPKMKSILVTKDVNLRMKARSIGLLCEDYINDKVINVDIFEKLRHMEYFDYEIVCEKETEQYVIPKLTLQPILENAIVHGTASDGRMCFVSLSIKNAADTVVITVKDDGNGIEPEKLRQLNKNLDEARGEEKGSFGLFSINRRVRLLYGTEYGIRLESEPGKGTIVILRIPKLEHLDETASSILERDQETAGRKQYEENRYY